MVDINQTNDDKETALHASCRNCNATATSILCLYKADCNFQNSQKDTPLHLATKNKSEECVTVLMEHGANPNLPGFQDITAINLAAKGNMEGILKILGGKTIVKKKNKSFRNSLHSHTLMGPKTVFNLSFFFVHTFTKKFRFKKKKPSPAVSKKKNAEQYAPLISLENHDEEQQVLVSKPNFDVDSPPDINMLFNLFKNTLFGLNLVKFLFFGFDF